MSVIDPQLRPPVTTIRIPSTAATLLQPSLLAAPALLQPPPSATAPLPAPPTAGDPTPLPPVSPAAASLTPSLTLSPPILSPPHQPATAQIPLPFALPGFRFPPPVSSETVSATAHPAPAPALTQELSPISIPKVASPQTHKTGSQKRSRTDTVSTTATPLPPSAIALPRPVFLTPGGAMSSHVVLGRDAHTTRGADPTNISAGPPSVLSVRSVDTAGVPAAVVNATPTQADLPQPPEERTRRIRKPTGRKEVVPLTGTGLTNTQ